MIEKRQLITILVAMIILGTFIYSSQYRNKEKPKIGVKRNNLSGYLKDYLNLKLYTASIIFIVFGIVVLTAILIIDLIFS